MTLFPCAVQYAPAVEFLKGWFKRRVLWCSLWICISHKFPEPPMLLVRDNALRIMDFGEQMQAEYVNTDA